MFDESSQRPNHRYVFPDEIVIDIDTDDKESIKLMKNHAISRLEFMGKSYSLWKTPSGKYHIHVFFPDLFSMQKEVRKLYKVYLFKYILGEAFFRLGKVDEQLVRSSRHLIRAEYGYYEKTYPKLAYKKLIKKYLSPTEKTIPLAVTKQVMGRLSKKKDLKVEYRKEIYGSNKDVPKCVQYLLSQDFGSLGDGRDRALFFLTYWFKKTSQSDWKEKVRRYNKYVLNNYFKEFIVESKINYRENSNSRFTHGFLHDLLNDLGVRHDCGCGRDEFI